MGNSQSFDITQPQKEHGGKHLQNGEANGHAISASDSLDAVSCEVSVQQNSEPPVVAQTNNTKSSASVEVDVKQASAVAVSLEVSPEQQIPVENSTPAKEEAPKPAQKASLFKMFKKKNELVTPTSEDKSASVQQNSEPTAETQTNNTQSSAESVEVDAKEVSAVIVSLEVSPEQEIPAESTTPAKEEAPKPAQKPSLFKMFKKKNEPVTPASEASCEVPVQENSEPTAETHTNNTQSPAEPVEVDPKQVSAVVVPLEVSPEQQIPVESSTPAKEEAPKPTQTASFFKMFKKKNEPVTPASEVSCEVSVQQNCDPPAMTDNTKTSAEAVEVDAKEASAVVVSLEVSPEQEISVESSTSAKEEAPKPAQTASFFKLFRKKNEPVTPASEVSCEVSVQQNSEPPPVTQASNAEPSAEAVEVDAKQASAVVVSLEVSPEQPIPVESSTPAKEDAPKPAQTGSFFKMFKKKNEPITPASESKGSAVEQIVPEVHTDGQMSEPPDIKGSAEPEKEPQGETLNSSAAEVAEDSTQPEETDPEENPVMNFFKTLVSPTKTTKEATAAPDASKDQSQKETPSASAPNVQELPKVPPPPPPAPPKMESKAESALKKEEAPPVEAAAAAKEQETPSKAKAKDSPFGKLFRPKSVVKEEAQPVEVQVDASKTSTLEAAAKPEPPPAPKPEEKKPEKKPSPFANLLKPKATEPKKDASPAPVVTEAVASTKVKEEPKPAVTAAAAPAAPDNKSVGSTDNPSPSVPRKLEKRNSIQLFFKNLGQKRHSDAGVQTEAVAPEKAK